MITKVKLEQVIPKGDRVLVHIEKIPNVSDSGIILEDGNEFNSTKMDISNYIGKVISMGDTELVHKHTPELQIGDNVMFSQFAGYHVPTEKGVFGKVVHAHDIHCKVDNPMKFGKDNVTPMGARISVEILKPEDTTESGIFVGTAESDPRELDMEKCKVLGVGPNAKEYKEDDIVFIPEYVGNKVPLGDIMLKTVNYDDVLFMIKQ